jgi:hypothetical protein
MDITSDGFGFMLAIALCWVPFVYCLQARFLVFNPVELGPLLAVVVVACNFTGYYIFRVANAEKNDFRNGKNPKSKPFFSLFVKSLISCFQICNTSPPSLGPNCLRPVGGGLLDIPTICTAFNFFRPLSHKFIFAAATY